MQWSPAAAPVRGHYLRRRLASAGVALWAGWLAIALIVTSILIYRFGGIDAIVLLDVLVLAAVLAIFGVLLALFGLLVVWFQEADGGGTAFAALCVSVFALLPFGVGGYFASVNPWANAAYTEGLEPDGIGAAIAAAEHSGDPVTAREAIVAAERPSVVPGRRFLAAAPRVFEAVRTVLDDRSWEIGEVTTVASVAAQNGESLPPGINIPIPRLRSTLQDEVPADPLDLPDSEAYRLTAVARDPIFALPSDIVIEVTQDGRETFVDLQSAFRAIPLDLGHNRRLIESFLADLDTAMAGLEGIPADG